MEVVDECEGSAGPRVIADRGMEDPILAPEPERETAPGPGPERNDTAVVPTMQTSAGSDAEGPPAPTRQQQREAEIMQTATRMYYLGFCLLCANVPIGTSLLCNRLG